MDESLQFAAHTVTYGRASQRAAFCLYSG